MCSYYDISIFVFLTTVRILMIIAIIPLIMLPMTIKIITNGRDNFIEKNNTVTLKMLKGVTYMYFFCISTNRTKVNEYS